MFNFIRRFFLERKQRRWICEGFAKWIRLSPKIISENWDKMGYSKKIPSVMPIADIMEFLIELEEEKIIIRDSHSTGDPTEQTYRTMVIENLHDKYVKTFGSGGKVNC